MYWYDSYQSPHGRMLLVAADDRDYDNYRRFYKTTQVK